MPRQLQRPRVIANFAISADGKISTREYAPTGFTSPRDKRLLGEIRALGDALMVGRRTLETDQMTMTISRPALVRARLARGQERYPLRIILTSLAQVSSDWRVFHREGGKILLATRDAAGPFQRADWRGGVEVYSRKNFSLAKFLGWLAAEKGIRTLVCEGGPTLLRELVELDLLDELYLTIAPRLFGGEKAPTLTGLPGDFLSNGKIFSLVSARLVASEVFCHFSRFDAL